MLKLLFLAWIQKENPNFSDVNSFVHDFTYDSARNIPGHWQYNDTKWSTFPTFTLNTALCYASLMYFVVFSLFDYRQEGFWYF